MQAFQWIFVSLLLTMAAPSALGARGEIDVDIDARGELGVAARAAARGEGRVSYAWDWGDGEVSAGASSRHQYREPGVYRVIVTATDDSGRTWTRARDVEVEARERALDVEVDGSRARAEADMGSRARVRWDWGDGSVSYGRRASHRYEEPGAYEVTLVVEERDGTRWSQKRTVVVEGERGREGGKEDEERAEARAEVRVRAPAVGARVGLGWEEAREARAEARSWRSDASVRIASQERHDAPGVGAPLVLGAVAGIALLGRKLMTK